jgi:hypothetical protein
MYEVYALKYGERDTTALAGVTAKSRAQAGRVLADLS